jgi:hypothetical protein
LSDNFATECLFREETRLQLLPTAPQQTR